MQVLYCCNDSHDADALSIDYIQTCLAEVMRYHYPKEAICSWLQTSTSLHAPALQKVTPGSEPVQLSKMSSPSEG